MLSKYSEEERVKLGYGRDEAIHPETVSAYLLSINEEEQYTELIKLSITDRGIDESEFTKIAEELADERFRLE